MAETCETEWILQNRAAIINGVNIAYSRLINHDTQAVIKVSYPGFGYRYISRMEKITVYNPDESGDYISVSWVKEKTRTVYGFPEKTDVEMKVCRGTDIYEPTVIPPFVPYVPPVEPPYEPPVEPPYEPPVEPPYEPPVPPVEPPYEPPVPPVEPPYEPPVIYPVEEKELGIGEKLVLGTIVALLVFWSMG